MQSGTVSTGEIMKNLTQGSIYKNFIIFAIPMVLSGLLSQMYNTIDTVIAGKFVGDTSLAAIGATSPFIMFVSSIFWGCGAGFAIYIAERFGADDFSAIKRDMYNGYVIIITALIFCSAMSVIFREAIVGFLKVDKTIHDEAVQYFGIYMGGSTFILLSYCGVYILNAFGSGSFPFLMSVISAVLNIAGNIVSVTVFNLGVAGIAFSSVFAALVVDICYFIKILKCFSEMGVLKKRFPFEPKRFLQCANYWFPNTFQQTVMYTSGMLLSPILNLLGSDASASYTVCLRIYDFNANIYQNSAKTVSTYTAQCVGAKKTDLLKKGLWVGLLQGLMFLSIPLLACVIFPKQICYIFFKSDYTGLGIQYSVVFMRYFMPMIVFNLVANLFHAFFRGMAIMRPLVIATFIGSSVKLVAGYILLKLFGVYGFFTGWALSWLSDAVFGFICYCNPSWREKLQMRICGS